MSIESKINLTQPVSCVVPARFAASRFPGKLLSPLAGEPLILHTLRRAEMAECFDEILCLTDSEKILSIVRKAGFRAELSGPASNGTERIARNLHTISHNLIVNLQGDEPVFPLSALRLLSHAIQVDSHSAHVLVHAHELTAEELKNPHRCKAGLDKNYRVVDFYRAEPHAFLHPTFSIAQSRMQLGSYGYSKNYLRQYLNCPISDLERLESHEMLRDLNLAPIQAHICDQRSQSVDVPQDLEAAKAILLSQFK